MQFDKDLNSQKAELFLEVRECLTSEIEKYVDKAIEKYSENITSIFAKELCGGFCYIRVKEDYVHIGWFRGAEINDKNGLLVGKGKQIRGHIIRSLDEAQKKAIAYYIMQTYYILVEKHELQKMRK